jgi:hypothetical protein
MCRAKDVAKVHKGAQRWETIKATKQHRIGWEPTWWTYNSMELGMEIVWNNFMLNIISSYGMSSFGSTPIPTPQYMAQIQFHK